MQLIRKRAFARAGLVGNPSDGYGGKTISVIVPHFCAEVVLYEWDQVEIVWSQEDQNRFRSVQDLLADVRLHGYYGGVRLVKATIKKFVEHCLRQGTPLHDGKFSIRYQSNIPRQVGLAGSSAIIVATLRGLMEFYGVAIPREVSPSLALSVETDELGIAAGLQDRVIQVYEGVVYMDFDPSARREIHGLSCGIYQPLDPALLPPLYLAYDANVAEPTEILHNDLRARYQRGDTAVVDAMKKFAELAVQGKNALLARDFDAMARTMNANFDLRRSICRLLPEHVAMIETARRTGASAKYAGSGGAIVGIYRDEEMLSRLRAGLEPLGCRVLTVCL
jgi:glucuronokinase